MNVAKGAVIAEPVEIFVAERIGDRFSDITDAGDLMEYFGAFNPAARHFTRERLQRHRRARLQTVFVRSYNLVRPPRIQLLVQSVVALPSLILPQFVPIFFSIFHYFS